MYTFFTYFKKSFTITEITRRIFQFSSQMNIQYLHTFMGSHVTPIQKSVSSDCMEGMPDIDNTCPPYSVSFRCWVANTQKACPIIVGFSKSNTFKTIQLILKHFLLQIIPVLDVVNSSSTLLHRQPSLDSVQLTFCVHDSVGSIPLRYRVTHMKAIQIYQL